MLTSSEPQFSCSNANIHCSSSVKHLCTLHTGTASWRILSIFTFKAVRKTHPTVPTAVGTTCLPKRNSLPAMSFECYPVNRPPLPSPRRSPRREDGSHKVPHVLWWPLAYSIQWSLRLLCLLGILPTTPIVLLILLMTPIVSLYLTVHIVR